MYEVTRTYKVYSIDELPEKMKDKARALFRDDLVNQALSDAQDDIYWDYMPDEFGMKMNLKEGLYFDLYYNTVSFVAYPVDYLTLYEEFLPPRMRAWRVPPTPWAEKYIRHIIKAGWGCFTWKRLNTVGLGSGTTPMSLPSTTAATPLPSSGNRGWKLRRMRRCAKCAAPSRNSVPI